MEAAPIVPAATAGGEDENGVLRLNDLCSNSRLSELI
jgi:hypothetical protein